LKVFGKKVVKKIRLSARYANVRNRNGFLEEDCRGGDFFGKRGGGIGDFQEVVFSEQFLCGAFVEIFPIRLGDK